MTLNAPQLEQLCINAIRTLSMDAVQKANIGHPGLPMGAAAMAYVLWMRFLKHHPKNPDWPDRDRFVLSAGHGSMLLYSLLYLTGYDLSLEDIKNFRQWESKTPGHPEFGVTPGVETTTGPLGQGMANTVGMAIASRHLAATFNRPGHAIVDHNIYAIVSDGDLMEGITHEAASLAGHLKLSNLICLYDDNRITIEGATDLAFSEDVLARFAAYGWHTQRVNDGNDPDAVGDAIATALEQDQGPALIAVRTHIGYGSPNKQDTAAAHGAPLGEKEIELTKRALGWPSLEPFFVPEEVLDHFHGAIHKGQAAESQWLERFAAYQQKFPQLAQRFQAALAGKLPQGWDADLPTFEPDDKPLATRKASGLALNAVARRLPMLIGGSADLAGSNNTTLNDTESFAPGQYHGRNFHFGIREHAMGGVLNGMALHGGILPYGGTFLVFSDYMRPAMRLAALMAQRVIYVFTHDSIGLGEDGPTHQPVEQLMALRTIPNLTVIRPADAAETVAAWQFAIKNDRGPTALALTRQSLPHLARQGLNALEGVSRGGYVLADVQNGLPEIILIGTGSETQWALQAQRQLTKEGVAARAVSLPSWEIFEAQAQEYRHQVLPETVRKRLSIEAGTTLGWERYVGWEGTMIGLNRFGASAPGDLLMEKFGFNLENVLAQARKLLKS